MSKKTDNKSVIAHKSEKVSQWTNKSGSKSSGSNNSGSKKTVTKPKIPHKSEKVLQLTKKSGSKSSASNTSGSKKTVTKKVAPKKVAPKVAPKPQIHNFVLTKKNKLNESNAFSRGMSGNSGKSVKPGKLGNRVSIFENSLHSSSHSILSSKSNTPKNSGKMSSTQDNTIKFLTPLPRSTHTPLNKRPTKKEEITRPSARKNSSKSSNQMSSIMENSTQTNYIYAVPNKKTESLNKRPPTKEITIPSARKNSSKSSNQIPSIMEKSTHFRPPQPLPKQNINKPNSNPNKKNDIYAVPNKKKEPKPSQRQETNETKETKETNYAKFGNKDPNYAEANEVLQDYETYLPTASNNDSNIYEEFNDLPSNNTQRTKPIPSQKLDPKRVRDLEKVLSKQEPKKKTQISVIARIKNIFGSCIGAKCKTKKRKGSNSNSSNPNSSEA